MDRFFGQDTPFFRFMTVAGNVIAVSLFWLLCCIPVVTVGPASIAMYYTMVKMVRHGEGYVTREFFGSFKRNLKQGILMTLIFAALAAGLAADRIYINGMYEQNGQAQVLGLNIGGQAAAAMSLGYTLLILVVLGVFLYIWPVMSRFTMGMWECFKLALLMVFRHLPYTVVFTAMWVLCLFGVVLIPVPMIFVLPGACCFAETFLMEKLLRKYMAKPETEEDMEKWYYRDERKKKEAERGGKEE